MNFIYEGMSPEELAAKRAELESELMAAQFEHEFESVQMMHELRLKDIEKQIILENCSIEKVADLYANEEDLYTEAEEGLISKVLNWLLGIVKSIFNIKDTKVDPAEKNDQIELDVDIRSLNKGTKTVVSKLRDITNIKDPNTGEIKVGAIVFNGLIGISAVTGVKALANAVKKKITITKDEAHREATETDANIHQITEELKRIGESMKEHTEAFQKCATEMSPLLKVAESAINEVGKKTGTDPNAKKDDNNDGGKTEPASGGEGNSKDNTEKTDGNAGASGGNNNGSNTGSGNNGNAGGKGKKGGAINYEVAADKTMGEGDRVDAIINAVRPHLRYGADGISRCSDKDWKKYHEDVVIELDKKANDNKNYDDDAQRVFKQAAKILRGDAMNKHQAAADGGADADPFTYISGLSRMDMAHKNLEKQAGYDPSTNTVTCSQQELDNLRSYYNKLTTEKKWQGRPYDESSEHWKIWDTCAQILQNAKVQKAANSGSNGAVDPDILKTAKRELSAYERNGKWYIGLSKDSYDNYIFKLDNEINRLKNDPSKAKDYERAFKLRNFASECAKNSNKAAKKGEKHAWNGTGSAQLGYNSNGIPTINGKSDKQIRSMLLNELKKPVADGGLGLVLSDPNNPNAKIYSKELDTEAKYQAEVNKLKNEMNSFPAGSDGRNWYKRKVDLAEAYQSQIFGTQPKQQPGNPPPSGSPAVDLKIYMNLLTKFFKVDIPKKKKPKTVADLDAMTLVAFKEYQGSDRTNKPKDYGTAAHPEWKRIVALQACNVFKNRAKNNRDTDTEAALDHLIQQYKKFDYPSWMLEKKADDPAFNQPPAGAAQTVKDAYTQAMADFKKMIHNAAA